MADTIQIKRGVKSEIPNLLIGEFGYCTDTDELYIGTSAGNKLIGKVALEEAVANLQTTVTEHGDRITALETSVGGKLTATPAQAVTDITEEADLASVITTINTILANMRASGLMNTEEGGEAVG